MVFRSCTKTQHDDREDTDCSSESFSSDSEVELPDIRTVIKPHQFFLEAKQTQKVERKVRKAKVAAEKADAKTKGLKRLKAIKNANGSLKKPQRR